MIFQSRPVEAFPRVGLAARGDVFVAGDVLARKCGIGGQQGIDDGIELDVLNVFVGRIVGALQLNPDREVIADGAVAVAGNAGMPGALIEGDVLYQFARAADQEMCGNPEVSDALVVGVLAGIQRIGEKLGDALRAKLSRGKADAVNDDQREIVWRLPFVAVGAGNEERPLDAVVDDFHVWMRADHGLLAQAARLGFERVQQEHDDTHGDGGVGYVESGPVPVADIDIEKVDDVAIENSVDQIA